jgi:hypothetical protein
MTDINRVIIPTELEIDHGYKVTDIKDRKIPLMPSFKPSGGKVFYLSENEVFQVLDSRIKISTWYQVVIPRTMLKGWINSVALFGLELEEVDLSR